ncbi:hypothetical protein [Nitratireductor sp. XY-223]|uniref:hypothetical protein n=1 Tax=Nitratireductor sp. XY-223 TaxID=2561926 RepID=UPI0010A9D489|nr:hypothetical protein [Nitratireductor sp. XY-223]
MSPITFNSPLIWKLGDRKAGKSEPRFDGGTAGIFAQDRHWNRRFRKLFAVKNAARILQEPVSFTRKKRSFSTCLNASTFHQSDVFDACISVFSNGLIRSFSMAVSVAISDRDDDFRVRPGRIRIADMVAGKRFSARPFGVTATLPSTQAPSEKPPEAIRFRLRQERVLRALRSGLRVI